MQDKTNQILKASISVFVKKGYIAATTKEIAKKANVAEVTLYRKFGTKKNLFEHSVKSITDDKFSSILKINQEISQYDFFKQLITNRLTVISKNISVVKMLISESLAGHLPKDLKFTDVIFEEISGAIKQYFEIKDIKLDSQAYAKIVLGILLGYAILPLQKPFHSLSSEDKAIFVNNYLEIITNNNL
ncbi:MAG: TetR/AcrR family transcriptional regulator [Candidatus Izemoplasma sp.]